MVTSTLFVKALMSLLLSASLKALTKKTLPVFNGLLAEMRSFSIGDIVSLSNVGNFQVIEKRGATFRYEYKLVDIKGSIRGFFRRFPIIPTLRKHCQCFGTRELEYAPILGKSVIQSWN